MSAVLQSCVLLVLFLCLSEQRVTAQIVRLADSKVNGTGRVEAIVNGKWSTFQKSHFTDSDAAVICRMLGYGSTGIASVLDTDQFAQGTGQVVMSDLQCKGTETNITQCAAITARDYPHFSDVSISCVPTQIRLVDGDTQYSGRVEILVQGEWSSICDNGFVTDDARVICSMLGFGNTGIAMAFSSSTYGTGSGKVQLASLGCKGTETDVVQCTGHWGNNRCLHRQDAGVNCGSTKVRLVDGPTKDSGRVEIFHAGTWGTVCDSRDTFDRRNAMVICRMLGYNASNAFGHNEAFYGEGHGPVIAYNFDCDGSESDLANCQHQGDWHTSASPSSHCQHSRDVGVDCSGRTKIRLVDGNSEQSGRVELYRNGHWGTLGASGFDNHDLEVICRMLGYEYSSKSFFSLNSYYGQGLGEVVADNLQCDGGEQDIGHCHGVRWWPHTSNTDHKSDVGVNCDGVVPLRLVDGPTNGTGRLEILHNGYYGTVCDSGFDRLDLIVVCRTLGYETIPRSAYFHGGAFFGQGLGEIVVSDLGCNGIEENIGKCSGRWLDARYCDHSKDVSVSCDGGFESVRLVNGTNQYSGRVEIQHGGSWRTVCHDNFDRADAVVVCRMMGYSHPEHARAFVKSEFGKGSGSILMTDLNCNGLESNLDQCRPNYSPNYCNSNDVAGVDCCPSCAGAPNFIVG